MVTIFLFSCGVGLLQGCEADLQIFGPLVNPVGLLCVTHRIGSGNCIRFLIWEHHPILCFHPVYVHLILVGWVLPVVVGGHLMGGVTPPIERHPMCPSTCFDDCF